ncbi:MAG: DUF945 family protein [Proteobacteria bacterium]|nr:DUF945 family protein [Pseudomonadota bacterium]MDA0992315.1 DUF945 family protein [Pseudomonadota bacterium]
MKRWLVILLVLLALVILVSPGIIGRLAEQNMEENIQWAKNESPGLNITTEAFDRGWFTSEGKHRVVFQGGRFRDATEKYAAVTGNPELPSLIIDTRFDHGLVPVTSLSRHAGSLAPGLASTLSTFHLDPGNGEPLPLPGTLYSNVSLTGATDSRLLVETGSYEHEDIQVDWDGADLKIYSNRGSGEMSVHGTIDPVTISGEDGRASIGVIRIDADQVRTEYGFNVGPANLTVGAMTLEDSGQKFVLGGMDVKMDSTLEDGRVDSTGTVAIRDVSIPGFGDVALVMDTSMNGFHAASLGAIVKALREAQAADDPNMALQMLYPDIEGDLQTLASSGAEIRFDQFDITLPQGTVATKIAVAVPESDGGADFSWPAVLLGMTASIDIRLPAELFDMATMMNPQAGALLAMGILQKEGNDYVMAAEYAQGLVSVNGVPMPIPIPGLSP